MAVRIGVISSVDKKTGMARVYFPESDEEVTEFLPYANFGMEYQIPEIGSRVITADLSDGGAVILGRYWDEANPGNPDGADRLFHKRLGDKAYIDYDGHTLTIAAGQVVTISLDEQEE